MRRTNFNGSSADDLLLLGVKIKHRRIVLQLVASLIYLIVSAVTHAQTTGLPRDAAPQQPAPPGTPFLSRPSAAKATYVTGTGQRYKGISGRIKGTALWL